MKPIWPDGGNLLSAAKLIHPHHLHDVHIVISYTGQLIQLNQRPFCALTVQGISARDDAPQEIHIGLAMMKPQNFRLGL